MKFINLELLKEEVSIKTYAKSLPQFREKGNIHCPFHDDKTPSLSIDKDGKLFKCHGCDVKGSVIDFVMKLKNLNFKEAVDFIIRDNHLYASRFRIDPPKSLPEARSTSRKALPVAAKPQPKALPAEPMLSVEQCKALHAKYTNILSRTDSYMLIPSDPDIANQYNLFQVKYAEFNIGNLRSENRIMFPIKNKDGYIVGLTMRTLKEDPHGRCKYLNTSSEEGLKTSHHLYGYYEFMNRPEPNKNGVKDTLFVVEGTKDVLAIRALGHYAVATLGAKLSSVQAQLLKSSGATIAIAYDPDNSGEGGRKAACELLRSMGVEPRNFTYPKEHDADSIYFKKVPSMLKQLLDCFLCPVLNAECYLLALCLIGSAHSVASANVFDKARSVSSAQSVKNYLRENNLRISNSNFELLNSIIENDINAFSYKSSSLIYKGQKSFISGLIERYSKRSFSVFKPQKRISKRQCAISDKLVYELNLGYFALLSYKLDELRDATSSEAKTELQRLWNLREKLSKKLKKSPYLPVGNLLIYSESLDNYIAENCKKAI